VTGHLELIRKPVKSIGSLVFPKERRRRLVVGMTRTKPWTVSDEFWEKVEPLIPPAPSHAKGGRTRIDDRKAFGAMIYVLRTGIQWNALPREMGASSTVHDRYQEWERLGFFEELWRAGLAEYDEL
jgi:putative transposase